MVEAVIGMAVGVSSDHSIYWNNSESQTVLHIRSVAQTQQM